MPKATSRVLPFVRSSQHPADGNKRYVEAEVARDVCMRLIGKIQVLIAAPNPTIGLMALDSFADLIVNGSDE